MKFGEKLQKLIRDTRHSQESIGKLVGVSQNMVSRWCRGVNVPDIHQAAALSRALGVSVDYLAIDDVNEPNPVTMTDREAMVWEFVRTIGADEAWRILVDSRRTPEKTAEGGRVLRPVTVEPKGVKGVG